MDRLLANETGDSEVLVGTAGLFADPPPFAPSEDPAAERLRALEGTLSDKLDYMQSRAIMTPQFKHAIEQISFCIVKAGCAVNAGGVVLVADGGCGKTFLSNQLLRRFPRYETLYRLEVPVAVVELSGTPDEKAVLRLLLTQLGGVVEHSRVSAADLEAKIIVACRQVRCRGIVLDEAHRLGTVSRSRREADRLMGPLGERIKRIYDRAKVAMVLLGTPSLGELVDSDPQYRTRWSGRVSLRPFPRSDSFRAVLGSYERILPMPERSDFTTPKIAYAIWDACKGYFRNLNALICDAMLIAIRDDAKSITATHLKEAYYLTGSAENENPFSALTDSGARR